MLLIYSAIESLTVKCLPNSYLKQCPIREVFANNKSDMLFHCTSYLDKLLINLTYLSLI